MSLENDLNKYPSLKKELEEKKKMIPLSFIDEEEAKLIEEDTEVEAEQKKEIDTTSDTSNFSGFIPTAIDYIRRCDTKEQALEIIDYLQKRGELTPTDFNKLKKQLTSKGLRSFGSKKDAGFYFNQNEK